MKAATTAAIGFDGVWDPRIAPTTTMAVLTTSVTVAFCFAPKST